MDTTSAQSCYRLRQAIGDEIRLLEESTRALKSRFNALAPISRLPPETLAATFSFLSPSASNKEVDYLTWICVTHVCRRWRETALNDPRLWSHINFTKLTPVAVAEMLSRAKMAPLHLEADVTHLSKPQLDAFGRQLEDHISHTRRLSISGRLPSAFKQLESPAPTLGYTAPILTSLELEGCDISWKSPLLKGLRTLQMIKPYTGVRPKLEDWLDALNEMAHLETLILQSAAPLASEAASHIPDPSRRVTLPSLTRLHITASAKDCVLALAHLVLPSLTRLHVDVTSLESEGEDVQLVIPYVAQNMDRMQGTEPLRSILINGKRTRAKVVAWAMPNVDAEVCDPDTLFSASVPARLMFSASGYNWGKGVDTAIFDALLTLLSVDSVSTVTVQSNTRLSKEFWLSHAPRWPLLERARLVPAAVKAFRDMLAEDAPPNVPRLPMLTKLTLIDVRLTTPRTYHLCSMLISRVEQGVPLEVLDLRTCVAADRAIELLREIVVDVLPARQRTMEEPALFNWHGGTDNEVGYDDEEQNGAVGELTGWPNLYHSSVQDDYGFGFHCYYTPPFSYISPPVLDTPWPQPATP